MYILVVEDETVLRELLASAVKAELGIEVATAASGMAAKVILEERGAPALVLADHVMLDGDGIFLGRICAETMPGVPFVLCSAAPEADLRAELSSAYAILPKPLQLDALALLLKGWRGRPRAASGA